MTFQLDTSGSVVTDNGKHTWTETTWPDLSPFCQGYTAAILEAANAPFHKLAPATLARIIADCEEVQEWGWASAAIGGHGFWRERNLPDAPEDRFMRPLREKFPPLTVTPGDDGLIYFKEAA